MLGRANADREMASRGVNDESLALACRLSPCLGRTFGQESLAMCGSASRWGCDRE
jgi:hypothetical protein